MAERLLVDTDVLIDYLRDTPEAVVYLESLSERMCISVLTIAELYSGVRDGAERAKLGTFLGAFEVVPVDEEIARVGGLYRRDYWKGHGTSLADALIAATAQVKQATLVTLNKRHFPMLAKVIVPYRKATA